MPTADGEAFLGGEVWDLEHRQGLDPARDWYRDPADLADEWHGHPLRQCGPAASLPRRRCEAKPAPLSSSTPVSSWGDLDSEYGEDETSIFEPSPTVVHRPVGRPLYLQDSQGDATLSSKQQDQQDQQHQQQQLTNLGGELWDMQLNIQGLLRQQEELISCIAEEEKAKKKKGRDEKRISVDTQESEAAPSSSRLGTPTSALTSGSLPRGTSFNPCHVLFGRDDLNRTRKEHRAKQEDGAKARDVARGGKSRAWLKWHGTSSETKTNSPRASHERGFPATVISMTELLDTQPGRKPSTGR